MDPESKLWLSIDVGDRTLAMAQRVVHQVTQVLAPDCAPLFLTDGFREYMTALLRHRSRAGCHCPSCAMPRWSKPCDAGV